MKIEPNKDNLLEINHQCISPQLFHSILNLGLRAAAKKGRSRLKETINEKNIKNQESLQFYCCLNIKSTCQYQIWFQLQRT